MAIKFIDLENAYTTIPREMTMGTLGWMGVPEAEVRMVERTYEDTKSRMLCGSGVSGEFKVNIGLTEGSADKQKDLYKRHTPETIIRIWPGSSSGWGSYSPRTADSVDRYFQQTWTEGTFGEDGGNVGGP